MSRDTLPAAMPQPPPRKPTPQRPGPLRAVNPRPIAATPFVVRRQSHAAAWGFWIVILIGGGFLGWQEWGKRERQVPAEAAPEVGEVARIEVKATPVPLQAAAPVPVPAMTPAAPMPMPAEAAPAKPAAPIATKDAIFTEPLVLDAVTGRKPEHLQRAAAALRGALVEGRWSDYQDLLRRSLALEFKKSFGFSQPQDYDRYLGNPLFHTALLQHHFLGLLPADARSMIVEYKGDTGFYTWLFTTPEALEPFLLAVRPEDAMKDALRTWALLQGEDPEARTKYRELAIAVALVFDRAFNPTWDGDTIKITAQERYTYYRDHDRQGQLATHISRLDARDLVWVVCAPVPSYELEWALKKFRALNQRDWGRTYGMVPYDMEKAVTGKPKKTYEAYTFAEILEKGGICGDQTYFSVNTARALGIPAASLGGDGPRGGHAWMAWKLDDHTWSTSGRLGGYGAGRTSDPQTGRGLSEQEFTRRSDRHAESDGRIGKAARFLWLAQLHQTLGDSAKADVAMEFAFAANRDASDMWLAKLAWWRTTRKDAPIEQWRTFMDAWKREYPQDSEMLAEARKAEETFIFPRQDSKLSLRELRQDARALDDPRKTDGPPPTAAEIARNFKRQAELLKPAKDWDAIRAIYHRGFRDHASDAAAFKAMAGDFFALVRDDEKARTEAAREIEGAFEKYVETRTTEYFSVTSQNSARGVVAKCWRTAGDEEKAARLEKENERRLKTAKRAAL